MYLNNPNVTHCLDSFQFIFLLSWLQLNYTKTISHENAPATNSRNYKLISMFYSEAQISIETNFAMYLHILY